MDIKRQPDSSILAQLGRRIARYRLNRNLTQGALAGEAGVSLATLQRMEAGRSAQTASLLRVLRALGLLDNLDALIPEPPESPLQQVKLAERTRQRARTSSPPERPSTWTWEDDE
jgi:transcriptional regulator with XRE-family HTH domain